MGMVSGMTLKSLCSGVRALTAQLDRSSLEPCFSKNSAVPSSTVASEAGSTMSTGSLSRTMALPSAPAAPTRWIVRVTIWRAVAAPGGGCAMSSAADFSSLEERSSGTDSLGCFCFFLLCFFDFLDFLSFLSFFASLVLGARAFWSRFLVRVLQ